MFQMEDRTIRRFGQTLWIVLCAAIVIGLMMTVLLMTLSRQDRAGDNGATRYQAAAYSSSYSSASSVSRS